MPDDIFEHVHSFTAKWEGGISKHPNDRGGVTAYGICLVYLKDVARRMPGLMATLNVRTPVNSASVLALTPRQAASIMRADFWERTRICQLPAACAAFAYDAAVNHGAITGVKFLQNACNAHGHSLAVDGLTGPKTIAAATSNPLDIALTGCQLRRQYYQKIGTGSQKVFLKGWLNRVTDQENFIRNNF